MSGVSNIGVRISMEGGKEVEAQALAVADSLKEVGTSATDAGAGAVDASGGIDKASAAMGKLTDSSLLSTAALADNARMIRMNAVDLELMHGATDSLIVSEDDATVSTGIFGSAMEALGLKADVLSADFLKVGKFASLAFIAAGAVVAFETAKMGLAYNKTTAQIAATANISENAANRISNAFLHTSNAVTFNAQDMATAFAPVSGQLQSITHGSLDTQSAMMFMNSAMTLSTASGEALGDTTKNLAEILQSYTLGVNQANNVTDLLYNTGRLTATSTTTLASTMDQLHSRLQQLVPSLADTSGLIYDLAQHGVSGARGTRMVAGALETLMSGAPDVNSMLNVLGISLASFYGPNGKFIGVANAIALLQPKLEKLTLRARLLAEQAIFGRSAAQGFGATVLAGVGAFEKSRDAVTRLNAAQEAAAKVTKSMSGQIDLLKKDLHNAGIDIGEFVLPKLVALGRWMMDNKPIVIAIAAVIGGILVTAMLSWAASVVVTAGAVIGLSAALSFGLLGIIALAVVAFVLIATHWRELWTGMKMIFDYVWHYLDEILHNDFVLALMGPVGGLIILAEHWKTVWTGMRELVRTVWNFLKPIFDAIKTGLGDLGKAAHAVGGFFGGVGHLLGFAEGGVVPGPQGAPMLAMVHGGEVITPPQNIYNASGMSMSPVMLGQAVSHVTPGSASSSSIPSQVISGNGGTSGPTVIQLVVDRKVLAELVYEQMQQDYARR